MPTQTQMFKLSHRNVFLLGLKIPFYHNVPTQTQMFKLSHRNVFLRATQMHLCSCNISLASSNGDLNEGFNLISYNEVFNGGFDLI